MFWTVRVPDRTVDVDFGDARAAIDIDDLDVEDYFTLANALQDGHSVSAEVSYHIRWFGVKQRVQVRDTNEHYRAHLIYDTATISWSARERGFRFVSDPAHTSTTKFAEIGRERNGVFFDRSEDP